MNRLKEDYLLWVVVLITLATRSLFITTPSVYIFDEGLHIPSAYNYVERGFPGPTAWYHPYFRNVSLFLSMKFLGDNPLGWRFPPMLISILCVYLIYLLAFKLTDSKRVAVIAAFLMSVDPLQIQGRINQDETIVQFTFMASLYSALCYVEKPKIGFLLAAGVMLGIGLSVKWYAILTMMVIFILCLKSLLKRQQDIYPKLEGTMLIFSTIIILPLTVYLLTFYPWFGRGYSLHDFIWQQVDMYTALQSVRGADFHIMSKLHASSVYNWFILPPLTGIKYQIQQSIIVLLFFGNPLIWLLTLPSIAYLSFSYLTSWKQAHLLIAITFLMQYVPLLFVKRPVYPHSALSILPMSFIAIAYTLEEFLNKANRYSVLNSYLFINLVIAAVLLPLLICYPIPVSIYDTYLSWLDNFLAVPE